VCLPGLKMRWQSNAEPHVESLHIPSLFLRGAHIGVASPYHSVTLGVMPEKKPILYLLVILPILVGGGLFAIIAVQTAYCRIAGVSLSSMPNLNGFLLSLPVFFLWIPIALILSNCVLHVVPPLKKVAEDYVSRTNAPGFAESQRQLTRFALFMALICVPLIFLGFIV
jgi:hypothetical protein